MNNEPGDLDLFLATRYCMSVSLFVMLLAQ